MFKSFLQKLFIIYKENIMSLSKKSRTQILEEKYKDEYKVIYKIIYPNGKIYVGQDFTNNYAYFGSLDESLLKNDFTEDEILSFSITKNIIYRDKDISKKNLDLLEKKYILDLNSNNPQIGYNKFPVYKKDKRLNKKLKPLCSLK